mgnify:FL=1
MKDSQELFKNYNIKFKGKVRDIYDVDSKHYLIVATDRISAFDYVFKEVILGKGKLLNSMTRFWFNKTKHIIQNHLRDKIIDIPKEEVDRCMVVEKINVLPIEAIVRGHLAGSSWENYKKNNIIEGMSVNNTFTKYQRFDEPIFTPSTKAEIGGKDENISFNKIKEIIGEDLSEKVRDISIKLYNFAYNYAKNQGVIIADTKFEFGLDSDGNLVLVDEIFTPDCSRFWLINKKNNEINYESFDKQFFRDYLVSINWADEDIFIPDEIKNKLIKRYQLAFDLLVK